MSSEQPRVLSMNFYKILKNDFSKFSTASLPAWCIQSSIAGNWLQLKCRSFGRKCLWWKPFTILNAYVHALFSNSFSFDSSLWWPLLLSTVSIKRHVQFPTSCSGSLIKSGFPHHVIIRHAYQNYSNSFVKSYTFYKTQTTQIYPQFLNIEH